MRFNTLRRTECFYEKNSGRENNEISSSKTISGMVTRQSTLTSSRLKELNHLFKPPSQLPIKKGNVKSLFSPKNKVQTGRVKSDVKLNQKSKVNFLTQPSFVNSRKTMCSRTNPNAKREVIQKMVFLAECALKENREIKQSTPVKLQIGLTPRKTPKFNYMALSELKKMSIRLDTQDTNKKETMSNSTQLSFTNDSFFDQKEDNKASCKSCSSFLLEVPVVSNSEVIGEMLRHCRIYNTEVGYLYGKLKMLEDCFQKNIKELPDYQVYDEFCSYQSKKEELYEELKTLEENFKTSIKNQTQVGSKLKDYVKKRKELFEKRTMLHKNFEEVVKSAMEQYQKNERLEEEKDKKEKEEEDKKEKEEEDKKEKKEEDKKEQQEEMTTIQEITEETSRIPRKCTLNKNTTPSTKLKKLDVKSKGIQKGRKRKF